MCPMSLKKGAIRPSVSLPHQPLEGDCMTTARTSPVVKTTAVESTAVPSAPDGSAKPFDVASLPVRPGEDPWTQEELDEVSAVLA